MTYTINLTFFILLPICCMTTDFLSGDKPSSRRTPDSSWCSVKMHIVPEGEWVLLISFASTSNRGSLTMGWEGIHCRLDIIYAFSPHSTVVSMKIDQYSFMDIDFSHLSCYDNGFAFGMTITQIDQALAHHGRTPSFKLCIHKYSVKVSENNIMSSLLRPSQGRSFCTVELLHPCDMCIAFYACSSTTWSTFTTHRTARCVLVYW